MKNYNVQIEKLLREVRSYIIDNTLIGTEARARAYPILSQIDHYLNDVRWRRMDSTGGWEADKDEEFVKFETEAPTSGRQEESDPDDPLASKSEPMFINMVDAMYVLEDAVNFVDSLGLRAYLGKPIPKKKLVRYCIDLADRMDSVITGPSRNCDWYKTKEEAWKAFLEECPKVWETYSHHKCSIDEVKDSFEFWLFLPAKNSISQTIEEADSSVK